MIRTPSFVSFTPASAPVPASDVEAAACWRQPCGGADRRSSGCCRRRGEAVLGDAPAPRVYFYGASLVNCERKEVDLKTVRLKETCQDITNYEKTEQGASNAKEVMDTYRCP